MPAADPIRFHLPRNAAGRPAARWVLVVLSLFGSNALAQQVRVVAPVGAIDRPAGPADEAGVAVELLENPNLDRYLRQAQGFLAREDYAGAIQVLQDVIEGRTVEAVGPAGAAEAPPAAAPPADSLKDSTGRLRIDHSQGQAPAAPRDRKSLSLQDLDAARAVYSQDGRLYRPVRRLCHELIAKLPPAGLELYRTTYEVAAAEMFDQAVALGSTAALEQVANRYFATVAAGRAMLLLADRLMHAGRYRAAVQVLRDVSEVYPESLQQKLGLAQVWCRFKIALCLRLAGEAAAAQALAQELAQQHADATLRLRGELQAIAELPRSDLFAVELQRGAPTTKVGSSWLAGGEAPLIPLWQLRFKNPEPYREPKGAGNNSENVLIVGDGARPTTMPHAGRHGPGTWVALSRPAAGALAAPPQALFLEHFRLRVADALTGVQTAATEATAEPPTPRENHPRVRVAAMDYALLRPVEDEARRYVLLGHQRNTSQSEEVLKACELKAYARDTLAAVWSSTQWLDGDAGLRDVTFLAAPTVFGERLLLPSLRRGVYAVECLDRSTGKPLWHTLLHAGGTSFFKAPGAPVAVQGGNAYVLTNAGVLAAVDAFAGELRWLRRYEREDPLRPKPAKKPAGRSSPRFGGVQFAQNELTGFQPSDVLVVAGLVVVAPCDSEMLLGIDAASGRPVWQFDATTRYAPYGKLRRLLGSDGKLLFLTSDTHLVALEAVGGLLRWCRELPVWNGPKVAGRGMGAVVDGRVLVPGERELLVFEADENQPMRRVALPGFGASREPLGGTFHVVADGPWLAIGYAGGVELFSTAPALRGLAAAATDPLLRANYLAQAGDADAAEATLRDGLAAATDDAARLPLAQRLLALVRARAIQLARHGEAPRAFAALDETLPRLVTEESRLGWHLAYLETCRETGDLLAYERAQQRLYDYMEGKR